MTPACFEARRGGNVCMCVRVCLLQTVCIRMAQLLDGAGKLGWVLLKAVLRFVFMFFNNCVAIPSYCLYLLLLQPLRIWDSSAFWHLEGVMFKWLLAMVSSWGWVAGYTGEMEAHDSHALATVSFALPVHVFFSSRLHIETIAFLIPHAFTTWLKIKVAGSI